MSFPTMINKTINGNKSNEFSNDMNINIPANVYETI